MSNKYIELIRDALDEYEDELTSENYKTDKYDEVIWDDVKLQTIAEEATWDGGEGGRYDTYIVKVTDGEIVKLYAIAHPYDSWDSPDIKESDIFEVKAVEVTKIEYHSV